MSAVDVVPVVVPDPLVDPDPDPEDPDPVDPLDDPDPEDPPELDPPDPDPEDPPLPVDDPPPPLEPEPVPLLSSTGASLPPHAIAKKIAANENAFVDFKTNLFLERTRNALKNRHFVARRTRFVNEWKVLLQGPQCVRT